MKRNNLKYTLIGLLLLWGTLLSAQVDFKLNAPDYVRQGERFKISFTVNEKPDEGISIPALEGLQILMGPSVFSSSSMNIVNGKMTTSKSFTYSYILLAEEKGKFTIPPTTITVNAKTYKSPSKTIEVLEGNAKIAKQPNSQHNTQSNRPSGSAIPSKNKGDNFFVRVLLSKTKAYPNEHIVATLKLYTRYGGISNVAITPPSFNGFLSKEIPNSAQNQFSQETIKGNIYNTAVIGKYVLFPQRSGKIKIDDFSINAVAQQRVSSGRSIFDDFFGGSMQQFKVKAKNPAVTVEVMPLPSNKPKSFTNAVGQFRINSTLSTDSIATNEAVTLTVTIKGNGNLQMQKAPKLHFSPDLEVYEPKTNSNSGITAAGMSGSTTFEYLIIPRQAGIFTLPEVQFSYFNPVTKSYQEKQTKAYTLKVTKGSGQSPTAGTAISRYPNNQQDVTALGNDIRYIKSRPPKFHKKGHYFWNSLLFWTLLLAIPFTTALYYVLAKKQQARSADILGTKSKRANKVAVKRLKTAKKSWEQNKKETFYTHTLEALWGFVSDKLHLPTSQLNKDNVQHLLQEQGVPTETIKDYIATLNECEMAQYAPISSVNMKSSYQKAVAIISKLEQNI